MLGKLSPDQIEQVLHTESVGRIGCHCEGLTYVVPVTYTYDGQRILAHSAEGMKLQMMRSNPRVCFQVDHIDDMGNWRSVITWGVFRELAHTEAAQAMGLLVERMRSHLTSKTFHHGHDPSAPLKAVAFEIALEHRTGRYERQAVVSAVSGG